MSEMGEKFNLEKVVHLFQDAHKFAEDLNHQYVTAEHLLKSMLNDDSVIELLKGCNIDPEKIRVDNEASLGRIPTKSFLSIVDEAQETVSFQRIKARAISQVVFSGKRDLVPSDFLLSLIQEPENYAAHSCLKNGLTPYKLKQAITEFNDDDDDSDEENQNPFMHPGMGSPSRKKKMTPKRAEKILRKYCVNLNNQASEGKIDNLIGREEEIFKLSKIASRRRKSNVIITAEPGTGKSAIVEGLAKLIVEKNVPETLLNATVWSLDVTALLAGTKFRGEFEERMNDVIKALAMVKEPILFIDEIHTIIGAGGGGSNGGADAANILKPALANGTIRCIGATTFEEYRKFFEKDRALNRRFQRLDVAEPSVADAKKILRGLRQYYEEFHGITYTDEALDAAVDLSKRYITDRMLPDKAIDLIDTAGAHQKVIPVNDRVKVIGKAEIEYEVSKVAKIPPVTVQESERDKLAKLLPNLQEKVFGQDEALTVLTNSIYVSRAGLREASKPMGSYLFPGPTGSGKSETAKTLAKTLNIPLIRFDMSEYMEKHSVSKLVGAPPGYVGFSDGGSGSGLLINAIDQSPSCVLLLDEIEKAHPDVFNILLQVMDDARLTSSTGKIVDFSNVIILMTSNAGASDMEKTSIGFGKSDNSSMGDEAIKKIFTPEFRNRLDAEVRFKKLTPEVMIKVVDKFLDELAEMAKAKNIKIKITDLARSWLATKGYDERMGARPLGRLIHKSIKEVLSKEMLFGKLVNGGTVTIDMNLKDDSLKFNYRSK